MADSNLERVYIIPLKDAYEKPRTRRAYYAVKIIREFAKRHMKADQVKISKGVNETIMRDGIQKPPRKIKVKIIKENAVARVFLFDEKIEKPEEKKQEKKQATSEKENKQKEETKTEQKKEAEQKNTAEEKRAENKN
jgi:large subunit ribosomal protein L31e